MSTLNVSTIQSLSTSTVPVIKNSSGTEVGQFVKAFLRYDQSTDTMGQNFNISSVDDISEGVFHVNFATAFPNANYAYTFGSKGQVASGGGEHTQVYTYFGDPTASKLQVGVFRPENSGARADDPRVCVIVCA